MTSAAGDREFTGSIPQAYETYLVPMLFEPYARDLADRVIARAPRRVLEIAAGTGVVTRRLAAGLPANTIVATDLNQDMLDKASAIGTARPVEWRQADAMQLPFDDASFDAVVCQFGVMFLPDKATAFAEARRVLAPGGALVFNVWDQLADNEFSDIVTKALASLFPADPPRFLPRTPYGYFDVQAIARDLAAGGFTNAPRIDTVDARSLAASPEVVAIGICQGTPLRAEIERRAPGGLAHATKAAADAIGRRFGRGAIDGRMRAHVVTIEA